MNYKIESLCILETNVDDMNPQIYDYLIDRLFNAGVLDVWIVPIQMKKNRPAQMLKVLILPAMLESTLEILFKETHTLGVRVSDIRRYSLPRSEKIIETPYGPVRFKAVIIDDQSELRAEYDDCKRIAQQTGQSLRKVMEEVNRLGDTLHSPPIS